MTTWVSGQKSMGDTDCVDKAVVAVLLSVQNAILDEDGDGSQDEGHKQIHVNEISGAVKLSAERKKTKTTKIKTSLCLNNAFPVYFFNILFIIHINIFHDFLIMIFEFHFAVCYSQPDADLNLQRITMAVVRDTSDVL